MRVQAVIPALNEAKTIGPIVSKCLNYVDRVMVVDGGSSDETCRVAAAAGAHVLRLDARGKGLAMRRAILEAEADAVIFVDADGSHVPEDIPALLGPILEGCADLVIASRLTGGSDELRYRGDHFLRTAGTRFIQACANLIFRTDLTDIQNGFRAIRIPVARDIGLRETGFCIEQEMALRCLTKGYCVVNIPSHEYRRAYGSSKLNLWTFAPLCLLSFFRLVLDHLFAHVVRGSH